MRQLRWHNLVQTSCLLMLGACTFDLPSSLEADTGTSALDMRVMPDASPRPPRDMSGDLPVLPRDMPQNMPDLPASGLDLGLGEDMPQPPGDMLSFDMMQADQGTVAPIYIICSGQRVDITRDENHCGGCDISCEQGRGECVDKVCVCPLDGALVCGEEGRCVDARFDPRNCGGCGVTCGAGQVCNEGMCECRPGLTACDGRCVDTLVEPRHCGMCGRDCGESNRCKAGECGESSLCGLQYTACFRDDRTACVKDNVDRESDLYCRPGKRFDILCGQECGGDELCFEPDDLINPIQCRPYRPARSCDQCPCAECRSDEACRRQILGIQDVTYCVRKP